MDRPYKLSEFASTTAVFLAYCFPFLLCGYHQDSFYYIPPLYPRITWTHTDGKQHTTYCHDKWLSNSAWLFYWNKRRHPSPLWCECIKMVPHRDISPLVFIHSMHSFQNTWTLNSMGCVWFQFCFVLQCLDISVFFSVLFRGSFMKNRGKIK